MFRSKESDVYYYYFVFSCYKKKALELQIRLLLNVAYFFVVVQEVATRRSPSNVINDPWVAYEMSLKVV